MIPKSIRHTGLTAQTLLITSPAKPQALSQLHTVGLSAV